jgi:hypothetical protein
MDVRSLPSGGGGPGRGIPSTGHNSLNFNELQQRVICSRRAAPAGRTPSSRSRPRADDGAGFHVRSFSVSVLDTTYFCTPLIQFVNASPERRGHAAAETRYVRRPCISASLCLASSAYVALHAFSLSRVRVMGNLGLHRRQEGSHSAVAQSNTPTDIIVYRGTRRSFEPPLAIGDPMTRGTECSHAGTEASLERLAAGRSSPATALHSFWHRRADSLRSSAA